MAVLTARACCFARCPETPKTSHTHYCPFPKLRTRPGTSAPHAQSADAPLWTKRRAKIGRTSACRPTSCPRRSLGPRGCLGCSLVAATRLLKLYLAGRALTRQGLAIYGCLPPGIPAPAVTVLLQPRKRPSCCDVRRRYLVRRGFLFTQSSAVPAALAFAGMWL